MTGTEQITAVEMARAAGVDAKKFRRALRAEGFPWHQHNAPWTVARGSAEHDAMRRVLDDLLNRGRV